MKRSRRQTLVPFRGITLRVLAPLLVAAALVAIAVAGYWLKRPAEAIAASCADPLAGCTLIHRGTPLNVRFLTPPLPLKAFVLSVKASGARKISAEFQMASMDMGFNRYDLRPSRDGEFTAHITLPACVSGRRDWVLYLEIDGIRYALPFSTR